MDRGIAVVIVAIGAFLSVARLRAEEKEGPSVDWKALQSAKVTLEQGLAAAQQRGKAISAKFEVEDGKLQLSVYTAKDGKFWEVIVDHASGKISKAEEIKEAEDLAAAKAQSHAMGKAKKSLRAAVESALKANAGYRALSITPSIESGHAVASVTLAGSSGAKTASASLE